MIFNSILVFVGGGLGCLCRYYLSLAYTSTVFPVSTLTANVLSCAVLGLVVGLLSGNLENHPVRLILLVGFCGGLSTFSTFSFETLQLLQGKQVVHALVSMLLNLVLCLSTIFLSIQTVKWAKQIF